METVAPGRQRSEPALAAPSCTSLSPARPKGRSYSAQPIADARLAVFELTRPSIPWNDRSGDCFREWLAIDRETFYDEARIAIIPMGLCYPGRAPSGGDMPPRPECAPTWHPILRPLFPQLRLTLLVGLYAQAYYLGPRRQPTMTATVAAWRDYAPEILPLPHPSWRTIGWQRKNPWFHGELLPELRQRVQGLLA